jgi:hypothetical protein
MAGWLTRSGGPQDELGAEARRLHREVQAAAALQVQLRDKEQQLQQWELSARRDNKAAVRVAEEAKLAAEVRPAPCMQLLPAIPQQPRHLQLSLDGIYAPAPPHSARRLHHLIYACHCSPSIMWAGFTPHYLRHLRPCNYQRTSTSCTPSFIALAFTLATLSFMHTCPPAQHLHCAAGSRSDCNPCTPG